MGMACMEMLASGLVTEPGLAISMATAERANCSAPFSAASAWARARRLAEARISIAERSGRGRG